MSGFGFRALVFSVLASAFQRLGSEASGLKGQASAPGSRLLELEALRSFGGTVTGTGDSQSKASASIAFAIRRAKRPRASQKGSESEPTTRNSEPTTRNNHRATKRAHPGAREHESTSRPTCRA